MTDPDALLLLPHIRVQNANAISSPLTWGFPSPTAFCGFTHALHRRLSADYGVALDGTVILCHAMAPQVVAPAGKRTKAFALMRHPVNATGGSAALIEEGRTHLDVSLVIGISGDDLDVGLEPAIAERARELAVTMRIAGGSVLSIEPPTIVDCPRGSARETTRRLARKLLPGFALVSRESLVDEHWATIRQHDPEASALDALLDLVRVNIEPPDPTAARESASAAWHLRSQPGWLVPIPVGFAPLSELYPPGVVRNARDRTVPFRFVEGLLSLGQWLSPHRLDDIRHGLWRQVVDPDQGIYRCTTPHFAGVLPIGEKNHGKE